MGFFISARLCKEVEDKDKILTSRCHVCERTIGRAQNIDTMKKKKKIIASRLMQLHKFKKKKNNQIVPMAISF